MQVREVSHVSCFDTILVCSVGINLLIFRTFASTDQVSQRLLHVCPLTDSQAGQLRCHHVLRLFASHEWHACWLSHSSFMSNLIFIRLLCFHFPLYPRPSFSNACFVGRKEHVCVVYFIYSTFCTSRAFCSLVLDAVELTDVVLVVIGLVDSSACVDHQPNHHDYLLTITKKTSYQHIRF